jgi:nitrite reductase/ring-hydroxylating ferredoxin subunit
MLSKEENELVTRVGPGTPMGMALRRYWVPALLAEELPEADGPPVRVRLLGENLVAFRDTDGGVGLLGYHCPHRGAPLFFGRNEEHGLRCVYHGWKFDRGGNCVDMPNEPPQSTFKDKIHHTAYPCLELAGVVWAYLGPPERQPPPPPAMEWARLSAGHAYCSKTFEACNYLQAMEGGLDTSHSSFLHRPDRTTRKQPTLDYRRRATAPRLEVLPTDYGYSYASIRHLPDDGRNYVRVYHFVMPFQQMRVFEGYVGKPVLKGHLWVPVDDTHTYVYNWFCHADGSPLTPEEILQEETEAGRGPDDLLPGYVLKRNATNDYLIDREAQRTHSWTGLPGVNTQDFVMQEGMGPVYDRTQEHLGTADVAIITMRRLLLDAARDMQAGREPLGAQATSVGRVRAAEMLLPADVPWHEAMQAALVARW